MGMKAGLGVVLVLVGSAVPVAAGRIRDDISNVSFVPPPYFQTTLGKKGTTVHYLLQPPDKSTTFTVGAVPDRKYTTVLPLNTNEVKQFCLQAQGRLPKGLNLGLSKRYLADGQNGFECRFSKGAGQTIFWVGIPEAGQLVYFMAQWPQKPTDEQINAFRQFLGSIQVF